MRARRLAVVLGVTLGLVAAEGVARVSGLEARLLAPLAPLQVSDVALFRPSADPALLYEPRPGAALDQVSDSPWAPGPRRVTINALGFRGATPRAPRPRWRLVALGGSNTFGAAVSDEDTWPAALERSLQARGVDAEVLNLGVYGYMDRQKAAMADRALATLEPDLLLLQVYNTGRRFLLDGAPLDEALARSPDLYPELLGAAPEVGGAGWRAWRASALLRCLVIGGERGARARGWWDPEPALIARATALDRAAVVDLAARSPVPLRLVVPPMGAGHAEVPALDLSALPDALGEEGRDIHPGPRAYAWYGEQLARMLVEQGLVQPDGG